MPMLPSSFSSNDHEKLGDYSALEPGEYLAKIVKTEIKESQNNRRNKYWKLEFVVIEGQYKDRKLWTNLNLINTNAQAVEIANKELATICEAAGKHNIDDTDELIGIPMKIRVKKTPATASYPEGNNINGYSAAEGYAQPQAAAAATTEPAEAKKKPWE
jgi:hypothetical protein